jgi:3-hydroxyanthranilate 3,4-dioxygenase
MQLERRPAMRDIKVTDLAVVMQSLAGAAQPVSVLWQEQDNLAFVARGRQHRSEFHIDPSDEIMMMLRGQMDLHYITPEGERQVVVLREGEVMHCPAGTPHSPRFSPESFLLVIERKRRPDELDRFVWFCDRCDATLFETSRRVADYRTDPVSSVYEEFCGSEAHRTCGKCGHVTPRP